MTMIELYCGFMAGLFLTHAHVVPEERTNRILDGAIATQDQFRYAVSIQLTGSVQTKSRGHRCGGALISLQHVVTSASSLYNKVIGSAPVLISYSQYRVFAGANFLTDDTLPDRIRTIANITVHPEYRGDSFVNDIAIITLSAPYPDSVVIPLSLPSQNYAPGDFSLCTVAGWGRSTSNVSVSLQLRYGCLYIQNQNMCAALYKGIIESKTIMPSMICAIPYENLTPSCTGDSGNALVCSNTFAGVMSQSLGCNVTNFPEVYTRVSNYTKWITTITGSGTVFSENTYMLIGLLFLLQIYFRM